MQKSTKRERESTEEHEDEDGRVDQANHEHFPVLDVVFLPQLLTAGERASEEAC
jgi:hypothetical protein